jgi:hypothetical protein
MIGGPFYRQILDGTWEVPRRWEMFTTFAAGKICEVEYLQDMGTSVFVLDRYALLENDERWSDPESLRRISSKRQAVRIGRSLCGALNEEAPDVRVVARCARRSGWDKVAMGKKNLCKR